MVNLVIRQPSIGMKYFACCFIPQSKMPLLLISLFLCQLRIAYVRSTRFLFEFPTSPTFYWNFLATNLHHSSDTCNFEDFQISCLLVVPSQPRVCHSTLIDHHVWQMCITFHGCTHQSRPKLKSHHLHQALVKSFKPISSCLWNTDIFAVLGVLGGISSFPVKKETMGCDAFQKTRNKYKYVLKLYTFIHSAT